MRRLNGLRGLTKVCAGFLMLSVVGITLPAIGAATPAPVSAAPEAPVADKGVTPNSEASDVNSAIWNMSRLENDLWFRARFVNQVRTYSNGNAALYVNRNWSGTIRQLESISGRNPLNWQVAQSGVYRYFRTNLGYSEPNATAMSVGYTQSLRWFFTNEWYPYSAPGGVTSPGGK